MIGRRDRLAKKLWEVVINEKWCKGCNICVEMCPVKILRLNDRFKAEVVDMDRCVGCMNCSNYCPEFAVTVKERGENG